MATQIVIDTAAAEKNIAELNKEVEALTSSLAQLDDEEKQLNATLARNGSLTAAEANQLQKVIAARKQQSAALDAVNAELSVNNKALQEQEARLKRSTSSARDLARMFGGTLGRTLADISEGIEKFGDISFRAFLRGASGAEIFRIALISTGVGALVVALGSLTAYFATTEQGAKEFKQTMDSLKSTFRPLLTLLQDIGSAILFVVRGFEEFNDANLLAADTIDKYRRLLVNVNDLKFEGSSVDNQLALLVRDITKAEIELSRIREDDYDARIAKEKEIADLRKEYVVKEQERLTKEAKLKEDIVRKDAENYEAALKRLGQLDYILKGIDTDDRSQADLITETNEAYEAQKVVVQELQDIYTKSAAEQVDAAAAATLSQVAMAKLDDDIFKRQQALQKEIEDNRKRAAELKKQREEKAFQDDNEIRLQERLVQLENQRLQIELDRLNALAGADTGDAGAGPRLQIEKKYIEDITAFRIESEQLVGKERELLEAQAEADIQALEAAYRDYIDTRNEENRLEAEQKIALNQAVADQQAALIEQEKNQRLAALSEVANAFIAIADLAAEGSKEQKALAIIAATINGLVAGVKAYAELGPILGGIAAGAIAVSTAAAIASISSQEIPESNLEPGFQVGGYTGYGRTDEVAGIVHKGEYVVPANVLGSAVGASLVAGLEGLRTGVNVPQPANIADQVVAGLRRSPIFVRVKDIVDGTGTYAKVIDSANY